MTAHSKRPKRRRHVSAKGRADAMPSSGFVQSKAASAKPAERIRATKDEPIRCASPPCYLSEIED